MTPDILVIHLSRFYYTTHAREKLDTPVDFPVSGLDLSPWVASEASHKHTRADHCLYDLCGVVNHFGGMGGGHYTAFALNTEPGDADGAAGPAPGVIGGSGPSAGRWFHYDDHHVSPVPADRVVSGR